MNNKKLNLIKELIAEGKERIEEHQKLIRYHKEHLYPAISETKEQIKQHEYAIKQELKEITVLRAIYNDVLALEIAKKSYVGKCNDFTEKDIQTLVRSGIDIL